MRMALASALLAVAAASQATVTLRYATYDGTDRLRVTRQLIGEFERSHPDIRIKLEVIPSYPMYRQKMLTLYAANVAPDVGQFDGSYLPLATRGALLPLNDFIAKSPDLKIDRYYQNVVRAYTRQGKLYMLPREILLFTLVFYNKRMFREAGVPYPSDDWTWDYEVRPELKSRDFFWTVDQMTRKGAQGKTTRYGFTTVWQGQLTSDMLQGLDLWPMDDFLAPRRVTYNRPEVIRTLQYSADIQNKTGWMPTPTDVGTRLTSDTYTLFTQGKVAMYQSGSWEIQRLRESLPPGKPGSFDWDVTLFPAFKERKRVSYGGAAGFGIFSSTAHPNEAWEFVKFMAGEPGMRANAEAGILQPVRQDLAREPGAWVPGKDTPPERRTPANLAITDAGALSLKIFDAPEYWFDAETALNAQIENVSHGRARAEEAIPLGVSQAQALLDRALAHQTKTPYPIAPAVVAALLLISGIVAWVYWPERRRRLSRAARSENRWGYFFIAPFLLGTLVFTLGPMILSLLMSFSDTDIVQTPHWRGVANYSEAATVDPVFWQALKVTGLFTLLSVPLGLISALGLALLLNVRVRGIPFFRSWYYLPSLGSAIAGIIVWRRIFNPDDGILNRIVYGADGHGNFLGLASLLSPLSPEGPVNWLGNEKTALISIVIMGLWGVGGGTIILLAGLQGIPEMYYEAAILDGANEWRRLRSVTLPLLTPALFFSLITGVIGSFQAFTQGYAMTGGGPNNATLFYMLHLYRKAFESLQMGYASALAWILFAIILVATMLQFRLSKWVYYEAK